MATSTVRVKGLKETVRAFNKLDKGITKELRTELKKAAEPVSASARSKIGRYRGANVGAIGPRAAGASVFVTDRAKKVTGQRPDFGHRIMGRLEEALDENRDKVLREVDNALGRFVDSEF